MHFNAEVTYDVLITVDPHILDLVSFSGIHSCMITDGRDVGLEFEPTWCTVRSHLMLIKYPTYTVECIAIQADKRLLF